MQARKYTRTQLARRRLVGELILLSVVFLIAIVLFGVSVYFFASREAGEALQNRPRGMFLGWLTLIAIGLILGRTRQIGVSLPKHLILIRETLQSVMLFMFVGVLAGSSYVLYTARGLVLQRPWGLLVAWFAILVFIGGCAKLRQIVRLAREK